MTRTTYALIDKLNNAPAGNYTALRATWHGAVMQRAFAVTLCHDARDVIVREYRTYHIAWQPTCENICDSGGTQNFSWPELNGGFQGGNPHDPWGIVSEELMTGIEAARTNYNRGGLRISSGYRCPHGNANSGGVGASLHMQGRAADLYSTDHAWTEEEFNLLRDAAEDTNPTGSLTWNQYADHHYHVAW